MADRSSPTASSHRALPALSSTRAVRGEIVNETAELAARYVRTKLVATPATQQTYGRVLRRFFEWAPADITVDDIGDELLAAYHKHLVAERPDGTRRSPATVKKDRAALNSFVRWLHEKGHITRRQLDDALDVSLPSVSTQDRDVPKSLTATQLARLLEVTEAQIHRDPLRGWRDLAIILVLVDGGLRAEELTYLDRLDFLPARAGAKKRKLHVRHGKGGRQRKVNLTVRATNAVLEYERHRAAAFGPAAGTDPLFITLGRRRVDGTYTRAGKRCWQWTLNDLVKRLGRRAGLPIELAHPHTLRHTCATQMLRRAGVTIADVQKHLGHVDIKTTAIYVRSSDDRLHDLVDRLEQPVPTLDEDLVAA